MLQHDLRPGINKPAGEHYTEHHFQLLPKQLPGASESRIYKAGRTEMSDRTTVGIDVLKFALDACIDTSEQLKHLENSTSGISLWLNQC